MPLRVRVEVDVLLRRLQRDAEPAADVDVFDRRDPSRELGATLHRVEKRRETRSQPTRPDVKMQTAHVQPLLAGERERLVEAIGIDAELRRLLASVGQLRRITRCRPAG